MSEVAYIVNSDKPYPAWIKEHRVFKSLPKIDKIFPRIGLPNFTESITVYSTESAKTNARQIVYFVVQELQYRIADLKTQLRTELNATGRERNEKCNAIQAAVNVMGALLDCINGKDLTAISEGKVTMTLPVDVFSGASSTPVFKKGEAFLKVLNKVNSVIAAIVPSWKINYEANAYFKEFSKLNLPNKDYKLTFSSTGPEGAWDIATASMRGIASCQTWTAPQSRGLIGSISSRYVAIVFVSGTTDFPPYGKQMLHRCMCRLVIHRVTGLPVLYLDSMYPSYNADIYSTIKEILENRSGLKVYASNTPGERDMVMREYHLLNEFSRTFLREGEYSYMDSILPVENRRVPVLATEENKTLSERQAYFTAKLEASIAAKRAAYVKNVKELKEFAASGEKDESKKPEISPAFQDLKKGQNAFQNILNFFTHCERGTPTSGRPTTYFLNEIFKGIGNSELKFTSNKECDMWILRTLISNYSSIKEKSWAVIQTGTWMKSFPASAKRFHETVLNDLKKELLLACKGA